MTQIKIHYIRINDFFAFQKQETLKQNFKRNSGKPKTKKKEKKKLKLKFRHKRSSDGINHSNLNYT